MEKIQKRAQNVSYEFPANQDLADILGRAFISIWQFLFCDLGIPELQISDFKILVPNLR